MVGDLIEILQVIIFFLGPLLVSNCVAVLPVHTLQVRLGKIPKDAQAISCLYSPTWQ
jgi:hypothetical protein